MSSRWSSSLYCPVWNSHEMNMGKTHPAFHGQEQEIQPYSGTCDTIDKKIQNPSNYLSIFSLSIRSRKIFGKKRFEMDFISLFRVELPKRLIKSPKQLKIENIANLLTGRKIATEIENLLLETSLIRFRKTLN